MDKIIVRHTSIAINNYSLGDKESLEKRLSLWDPTHFKLNPIGYVYDETSNTLTIPRGVDISYLEHIFDSPAEFSYKADPITPVSFRMKTFPRDDIQKKSLSFLIGENEFGYTKKYSQLLLNLDPGMGKTYVATAALSFMRSAAIVVTHADRIKEQWYNTFTTMTDLEDPHICNISSSKIIDNLLHKSRRNTFKVYLVNIQTLVSYAKHNGWESIHELFINLGIGVKIIDEAHLHFDAVMKLDFATNTKKTLYLTATFNRSEHDEDRLFALCMNNVVRYGAEVKSKIRKHIMYLGVFYNSKPPLDVEASMFTRQGFNKIRYASYCMNSKRFFDTLEYVIGYVTKKEGKIMILSSTIDSCSIIKDFVQALYPDKTVAEYHSKISAEDKARALGADIITSTSASAGTGVDIPGLRALIMTEAYSSKVIGEQVSGRLREYASDKNTFYIELIDEGFNKVKSMYKGRLSIFKKKCVSVNTLDVEPLFRQKGM